MLDFIANVVTSFRMLIKRILLRICLSGSIFPMIPARIYDDILLLHLSNTFRKLTLVTALSLMK